MQQTPPVQVSIPFPENEDNAGQGNVQGNVKQNAQSAGLRSRSSHLLGLSRALLANCYGLAQL